MLKNQLFGAVQELLKEWLLGFNPNDFNVSFLKTEKLKLQNSIVNSDKINLKLQEMESPFRLKAGMIGKLSVKVRNKSKIFNYDLCFLFRLHF